MIEKDCGIVLHSFKYGETGMITRIYTRNFGLLSFIVSGVRKPRAKVQNSYLQPLTQVDIVFYYSDRGGLMHLKEISCPNPYSQMPFQIAKTSVALFLAEVLSKVLKVSDSNAQLFDYIKDSVNHLDSTPLTNPDFHLAFLMQLSRFLGFFPRNNFNAEQCYFNLAEGMYQKSFGGHDYWLDKEMSAVFDRLTLLSPTQMEPLALGREKRLLMLHKLLDYYRLHHPEVKEIKSLAVLEEVFK